MCVCIYIYVERKGREIEKEGLEGCGFGVKS